MYSTATQEILKTYLKSEFLNKTLMIDLRHKSKRTHDVMTLIMRRLHQQVCPTLARFRAACPFTKLCKNH